MPNTHNTPEPQAVVEALRGALASALENLPDVTADHTFSPSMLADCCADIAALSHLLRLEPGTGAANVLAYL